MLPSSDGAALVAVLAMWAIFRLGRLVIEDIRAAHFGVAALADCLPFFSFLIVVFSFYSRIVCLLL
jgi:hypothetical protein